MATKTKPKTAARKGEPKAWAGLRRVGAMPVPFTAAEYDGKPMLAAIDTKREDKAAAEGLCAVCGRPMVTDAGADVWHHVTPIQLGLGISIASPGHRDCMVAATRFCPHLMDGPQVFVLSPDAASVRRPSNVRKGDMVHALGTIDRVAFARHGEVIGGFDVEPEQDDDATMSYFKRIGHEAAARVSILHANGK